MTSRTKGKRTHDMNHMQRLFVSMMAILLLTLIGSPMMKAKAAAMPLKIDGVSTTYTGKQVYVTFDGKAVNMKKTPGIVINGTSYVSYKNVFGDSKVNATVSYNSSTKKVTIKKYDTTIVMTVGSKTALVNGESKSMSAAPIRVKYINQNTTKVLVPTEFVAKTLGYDYSWSATATSVDAVFSSGLTLKMDGKTSFYHNIQASVSVNGKNVNLATLPGVLVDGTLMARAKKVVESKGINGSYRYDKNSKVVTICNDEVEIKLEVGSKVAYINGVAHNMPTSVRSIKNVISKKSYICVPIEFIVQTLGFNYRWDAKTSTAYVTTKQVTPPVVDDPSEGESTGEIDSQVLTTYQSLQVFDDVLTTVSGPMQVSVSRPWLGYIGSITSIRQEQKLDDGKEIYYISSTLPFSDVTSSEEESTIRIQAANMHTNDTVYSFYEGIVSNIQTKQLHETGDAQFTIALNSTSASYDMALTEDGCTLIVSVYPNYIHNVEIGTDTKGDYVKLTSVKPLDPQEMKSDHLITFLFQQTTNAVGDLTFQSKELKSVQNILLSQVDTMNTMLTIELVPQSSYVVERQSSDTYVIYIDTDKEPDIDSEPVEIEESKQLGILRDELEYTAIRIPLPTGIRMNDITHEDLYLKKQIRFYIDGEIIDFTNPNSFLYDDTYAKNIAIDNSSGNSVITITTNRICGFDYRIDNGYLCIAIDTPSNVYSKIVVLDPGHGGSDTGAISISQPKVYEKNLNYKILYTLSKEYYEDLGIKAYYTRIDDSRVELLTRPKFSAQVEADLFISLHMNSATATTAEGLEVYYYTGNTHTMNGLTGKRMAETLVTNLVGVMNAKNRGAKSSALAVLRNNTVPSVLIELGFISNKEELAKLTSETYQEKAAKCIATTIDDFFEDYPTGR